MSAKALSNDFYQKYGEKLLRKKREEKEVGGKMNVYRKQGGVMEELRAIAT